MQILGEQFSEKDKDGLLALNLDAFNSDIFTHGGPSAFPPDRSQTVLPSSILIGWEDKSLDKDAYDILRSLGTTITKAGIVDGQDLENAAAYTNYALFGTPLEKMYGKNVGRLRAIKRKYDPFHVMDLTGGFRF